MTTILRKATESQQSEWRPVPEGLWRWTVNKPEVLLSERFGNYRVRFPLTLTDDEKKRLEAEHGAPDEGVQQSWRTSYSCGLTLGWVQRDGTYKSTKLVDFLSGAVGSKNQKRFRDWVSSGGGPATDERMSDQQQLDAIAEWLGWWEGLEVYGSVTHEPDAKDPSIVWSRFGGAMPVGSLPGQKEDDYQALGLGKLRGMMAEVGSATGPKSAEQVAAPPRTYAEVFEDDDDGKKPMPQAAAIAAAKTINPDDLPF